MKRRKYLQTSFAGIGLLGSIFGLQSARACLSKNTDWLVKVEQNISDQKSLTVKTNGYTTENINIIPKRDIVYVVIQGEKDAQIGCSTTSKQVSLASVFDGVVTQIFLVIEVNGEKEIFGHIIRGDGWEAIKNTYTNTTTEN